MWEDDDGQNTGSDEGGRSGSGEEQWSIIKRDKYGYKKYEKKREWKLKYAGWDLKFMNAIVSESY